MPTESFGDIESRQGDGPSGIHANGERLSAGWRPSLGLQHGEVIWDDNGKVSGAPESSADDAVPVKIPSWSREDRFKRALVVPNHIQEILGNSIALGVLFVCFYVLPELGRATEGSARRSTIVILIFIFIQTFVTLIAAVPGDDTTNSEVNKRVNASILVAMVIYPCFGLWAATRSEEISSDNFVEELGINHLWNLIDEDVGTYQWGYVFPFFFWATSACILLRDSNYAFTMDRQGVVTDSRGKPMTALFRRKPSPLEKWTHRITRLITSSLWSILPTENRPAGGAGRFVFQLFAPFVVVFFYVGYRLMRYSAQEMVHIVQNPHDYSRIHSFVEHSGVIETETIQIATARFYVWVAFSIYCIVIRGVVGTKFFLSHVVRDRQSLKTRWVGWAGAIVESKRRRVLWAFRGLAYAFTHYYVCSTATMTPSSVLDMVTYYLYFCVFLSFFMEGAGAIFFGLSEAERGCKLQTPFVMFTEYWFWGAFNCYLQPFGTLVNVIFYLANKEHQKRLLLREILSPIILRDDNNYRYRLPKALQKSPREVTQKELDERLKEWISTWRRKRTDAGRDTTSITIRKKDDLSTNMTFDGPTVFRGTCFPTRDEWLFMRDHYEDYVPLKPWEKPYGPDKFLRWFPSYREEIKYLLSEPYDFDNRREVWMFGYGSLISPDFPPAGIVGNQKKQIIPYYMKKQAGYRRSWNYRHGSVGINALGLEKMPDNKDGSVNIVGCVYKMDYEKASDLFSFREEGYELLLVHEDFFEPMHPDYVMPKGVGYVWVCGQPVSKCGESGSCTDIACKRHLPTNDSPILQSYIDTIVEGALRYSTAGRGQVDGMNFAAALLSSTGGWNHPWQNDRLLAGRPWSFLSNYEIIDGLLSTCPESRAAFIKRSLTLGPLSHSRIQMLEDESDANEPWANAFYSGESRLSVLA